MKKKQKNTLTGKDILFCNDFKEKRIKCGMNQKEWADAIGISLGLVKGIEGYTRRCTPNTEKKVKDYMALFHADASDTRSLEERILYDIFLSYMGKIGKNEADYYATPCIQSLQKILSHADSFETRNEQVQYFQYLSTSLWMLNHISTESASAITDGLDVIDIVGKLYPDFVKKLDKHYKNASENPAPKKEEKTQQLSLFDAMDNT